MSMWRVQLATCQSWAFSIVHFGSLTHWRRDAVFAYLFHLFPSVSYGVKGSSLLDSHIPQPQIQSNQSHQGFRSLPCCRILRSILWWIKVVVALVSVHPRIELWCLVAYQNISEYIRMMIMMKMMKRSGTVTSVQIKDAHLAAWGLNANSWDSSADSLVDLGETRFISCQSGRSWIYGFRMPLKDVKGSKFNSMIQSVTKSNEWCTDASNGWQHRYRAEKWSRPMSHIRLLLDLWPSQNEHLKES